MKTEIKHFVNNEPYGYPWDCVVAEYLRKGFKKDCGEYEFVVLDRDYKVLKREKTTVFYNTEETALFDVANERLEKEYKLIMTDGMTAAEITEDLVLAKKKAKEKLENELKADDDNTFAKPIIGYLLKRCEEDGGIAQDVMQEHKTWKKCFDYINENARKQAVGNRGVVHVPDETAYEWAEDYYHKDDKEEEEKKAKEAAERKAKQEKEEAERKAKKKKEAAAKKAMEETKKALAEILKQNDGTDAFLIKGKGLILIVPKTGDEIREEGAALHHCVGSYVDRVAKGETSVFFIRKEDSPDKPYFTLEWKNNDIAQCRGLHNREMPPEVRAFTQAFKKKMLDSIEKDKRKCGGTSNGG